MFGVINLKRTLQPAIYYIMTDYDKKHKNRTSMWIAIGAIVLIILLLVWLTFADFFDDTDVAAFLIGPIC